jgi:glucose/arabinose dehydrogenase
MKLLAPALTAVVSLLLALTPGASARERAIPTVTVSAREFSFALSRARVPRAGAVRFVVRNDGSLPHNFKIGTKATRVLGHGQSQTLTVILKAGRYQFLCTVPGHAKLGMTGTFAVVRPTVVSKKPKQPVSTDTQSLKLTDIGAFTQPVMLTSPPGLPNETFVLEKPGIIIRLVNGVAQKQPFLDFSGNVDDGFETGALGLAFAPDYLSSGRFYVYYTNHTKSVVELVEYRGSSANREFADPGTARLVLKVVKPWENHNAGMLQFGPDGYLYVAIGDGDSADGTGTGNRPGAFAQTKNDLLGNILRIDPLHGDPYVVPSTNPFVSEPGSRPEVFAYGLRNPWRYWIDPQLGMFIGDVGFGAQEEIDLIPSANMLHGGENFGWPCYEGTGLQDATVTCANPVAPLYAYHHAKDFCSVIGGVVVRDPSLTSLEGSYLYSDYCGGQIEQLTLGKDGKAVVQDTGLRVQSPSSFGLDGAGRVYVLSVNGHVFRIEPQS